MLREVSTGIPQDLEEGMTTWSKSSPSLLHDSENGGVCVMNQKGRMFSKSRRAHGGIIGVLYALIRGFGVASGSQGDTADPPPSLESNVDNSDEQSAI